MKKIFILIVLFFVFIPTAFGADFSLGYKDSVSVGEVFEVSVLLDTKSEVINSAEVIFRYDVTGLDFLGYKDEGGVLKLWVNTPKAVGGTVSFGGIIPGGVVGTYDPEFSTLQKLTLVNLIFKAKKEGDYNFNFLDGKVLKHDGQGTKIPVFFVNNFIKVSSDFIENKNKENTYDNIPPEEFKVYFSDALKDSETPALIVFSAQDYGSGIAKFQLKKGGAWQDVTSPFEVKKSFFNQTLKLRAVDFAGNVRESSIDIPGDVSLKLFLGLLLIIVGGFFVSKLLKYIHAKRR